MTSRTLTAGDMAEQAGATIAHTALEAMLNAQDQAARVVILADALAHLCEDCAERDRAVAGFAGLLVNVLERGLGVDA